MRARRLALTCLVFGLFPPAAWGFEEAVRREVVDAGVHVPVLTRPPQLTHFVEAPYPEQAKGEGRSAEVKLVITIDADGTVGEARVAAPAGHGFDEAALDAVRQFRFLPAEVDGKPAAIQVEYAYHFVLARKPVPAKAPEAVLKGRLLAKGSRYRVPFATIRCGDDPDAPEVLSDEEGRFQLKTAPGVCHVRVVANGFRVFKHDEPLPPDTTTEVTYVISPVAGAYETVVRGAAESKEVAKQTISREEVQTVPGTFGDALRVIQDLPGVARAPYISGALIVRGSSPNETQTMLDGVAIPLLYHLGLGPSVVNSAFLDDIQFYPGGFGARYGRAIGGVVDVTTRKGAADTLHGEAKVDIMDAAAFVESPVTKGISVAASVRRSYLDGILPLALDVIAPNNGLSIVPRYWDYQVRADFGAPRSASPEQKRNTFYVMAFGSDDVLKLVTGSGTTINNQSVDLGAETLFHRLKGDWTFRDGNVTSVLAPYVGYDLGSFTFGAAQAKADIYNAGAREDFTAVLSRVVTLRAGLDVLFQHLIGSAQLPILADVQYVSFPGAEPHVEQQSIRRVLDGFDGAVYLEADFTFGRFTVTPGLRASYEREHGQTLGSLDPRLWVRYQLTARDVVKASAGLYSQPPGLTNLENPPFGTPTLGPEHAFQTSAGIEHRFSEAIDLDVTGFFNRRFDLIEQPGATVVNPDNTVTQYLYSNSGFGKAYGLEVLLRHKVTERFFGWVAYTFSRSILATPTSPQYHLSSYDETHILTVLGSYKLPWDLEAGLRFRYVTGRPYTPVNHPYDAYAVDADTFSGVTGPLLSAREPAFQQLDLRIEKSFLFRSWTLGVYLDVQNVYNATNQEAVIYDYRYRVREPLPGLPILPVLGVRGRF